MSNPPGRIEGHTRGSEGRGVLGFVVGGVVGLLGGAGVSENGRDLLDDPGRVLTILMVALVCACLIGAIAYRSGRRTFPVVG